VARVCVRRERKTRVEVESRQAVNGAVDEGRHCFGTLEGKCPCRRIEVDQPLADRACLEGAEAREVARSVGQCQLGARDTAAGYRTPPGRPYPKLPAEPPRVAPSLAEKVPQKK
jgi:hypothetical protein